MREADDSRPLHVQRLLDNINANIRDGANGAAMDALRVPRSCSRFTDDLVEVLEECLFTSCRVS